MRALSKIAAFLALSASTALVGVGCVAQTDESAVEDPSAELSADTDTDVAESEDALSEDDASSDENVAESDEALSSYHDDYDYYDDGHYRRRNICRRVRRCVDRRGFYECRYRFSRRTLRRCLGRSYGGYGYYW